jgi:hypothetical protein
MVALALSEEEDEGEWDALCQEARRHSVLIDEQLEIYYARAVCALRGGRCDAARRALAGARELASGSANWERRLSALDLEC